MTEQGVTTPEASSSLQVWSQLGLDRQTQIVRLVAQLAMNVLLIQKEIPQKEEPNVKSIDRPQSAS